MRLIFYVNKFSCEQPVDVFNGLLLFLLQAYKNSYLYFHAAIAKYNLSGDK